MQSNPYLKPVPLESLRMDSGLSKKPKMRNEKSPATIMIRSGTSYGQNKEGVVKELAKRKKKRGKSKKLISNASVPLLPYVGAFPESAQNRRLIKP